VRITESLNSGDAFSNCRGGADLEVQIAARERCSRCTGRDLVRLAVALSGNRQLLRQLGNRVGLLIQKRPRDPRHADSKLGATLLAMCPNPFKVPGRRCLWPTAHPQPTAH